MGNSTLKNSDSYLVLWDLPHDKTLKIYDLDSLISQGFDPYDAEEISFLFRCNVTLVTEIKESYRYKEPKQ